MNPSAQQQIQYLTERANWHKTCLEELSRDEIIHFMPAVLATKDAMATNYGELTREQETIRVAVIKYDGQSVTVPVQAIADFLEDGNDYEISFKTMATADFEALPDFNGF